MPRDPNSRLWMWLAVGVGLAGLILILLQLFPDALRTPGAWSAVAYSVGLVCLLLAGGLRLGAGEVGKGLKYGAIWLAIFGGLTLLVTFVQGRTGLESGASGREASPEAPPPSRRGPAPTPVGFTGEAGGTNSGSVREVDRL